MKFTQIVLSLFLLLLGACGKHSAKFLEQPKTEKGVQPPISKEEKLLNQVRNGEKKFLIQWVEDGNDINQRFTDGKTLLMEASAWAQLEILRLLMQAGADVHLLDDQGRDAFWYAQGNESVIQILNNEIDPIDELNKALLESASLGDHKEVRALLKKGAQVNTRNEAGQTPLIVSCQQGHEGVSRVLLSQEGIEINARDHHAMTALGYAKRNNHQRLIRILESLGAVD